MCSRTFFFPCDSNNVRSIPAFSRFQVKYDGVECEWNKAVELIMEGDSSTEKVKRSSFTTKYERPKEPYQIRPSVRMPIVTAPKPPPKVGIPTSFTANLLNQSPLIRVRIFFFSILPS